MRSINFGQFILNKLNKYYKTIFFSEIEGCKTEIHNCYLNYIVLKPLYRANLKNS